MQHPVANISGWRILVEPGIKSTFDFRVKYQQPLKRVRTPKHIHLIIDLYMKQTGNRELTKRLLRHMLEVLTQLSPVTEYPPSLQNYQQEHANEFADLDNYGEYPVTFLLIVFELIMIQEKTNYPSGTLNRKLFELLLNDADIFSVVSTATFRG